MSGEITRRLSTTTAVRSSNFLRESPNAYLNKTLLNRYTGLKYDQNKFVQVDKINFLLRFGFII
jgi:hypothetical protein